MLTDWRHALCDWICFGSYREFSLAKYIKIDESTNSNFTIFYDYDNKILSKSWPFSL